MLYKNMFFFGGGGFILFSSVQIGRFGRIRIEEEFFIIKSAISRPYSEILSNHVCDF